MEFLVDKKSGFVCYESPLIIYDSNGLPFYYRENIKKNQKFNLPEGNYSTQNFLVKLSKPVFYKLPKLKPRYVFIKYPDNFTEIYEPNPNKCTVDLDKATITYDTEYLDETRVIKAFIKFHELGHYRYSGHGQISERECDDFASWAMLQAGYNPSQVRYASEYSLGNDHLAKKRKDRNKKLLNKIK